MSSPASSERSKLIQPDSNGNGNKVYGKNMAEKEEPTISAFEMEPQGQAIILPSNIPTTQKFDSTPKGRTTAYIRRNIKMKGADGVEKPTTCFGDVEFRGAARRSMSKYIRLSNDTKPELIYRMMIKYWKMEEPRLLISVTGGAKSFALDPILKQNFTVGLSQIAATPGCWVISGGTNAGVMKHVGDALQGSNACIGIATWGILTKREMLQPDPDAGEAYVEKTALYEIGSWLTEKGAFLDNNHSHFLLVDDGSENKFGVEINFRGQLEKYIMDKAMAKDKNLQKVPTVLLVLEGGPGTLGTVYSAVAGEPSVPVVLVKSSGRAADLLVYALNLVDDIMALHCDGAPTSSDCKLHQGLLGQVNELFPPSNDNGFGYYKQIISCLAFKDSFTVSAVGSEMKIDDAIFEALLKDKNTHAYRQLQLSLVWNRADLAREKVFKTMVSWPGAPEELQWLTIMALAMNNVDFVELLLEYGISVSSFLTNELLEFLYGYRSFDKTSPLRYEFKTTDYVGADRKSENVRTYRRLVSYDDLVSIDACSIPRKKIVDLMKDLCSSLIKIGNETFLEDLSDISSKVGLVSMVRNAAGAQGRFTYPFRELFFWAVLNNMQGMAVLFWKHGHEHMAKALIASHVSDTMAQRRASQNDINTALVEAATFFRAGAVQLLDACYKTNDHMTSTLITSEFNQFEGVDILKVAVASENLDFVSHYSVQALIEDIWVGNLKDRDVSLIWVLLAWFLPPLVATFEFRTQEEIKLMVKTEEDYEEEMEDNDEEEEEEEAEDEDGDDDGDTKALTKTQTQTAINKANALAGKETIARGLGTPLTFCEKISEFYTTTPVVKFVTHTLAYIIFLLFFSFTSMTRKNQTMPNGVEWFVIVTAFAYLVAEVYQVIQVDAPSLKARLSEWSSSFLNVFDASVISLFFIALGLRLNEDTRQFGHLLYTLDCGLWWLRLLSILVIWPSLGPYLVMIKRMINDLVRFMAVMAIVLIAYGVTSRAILEPKDKHHPNMQMIIGPIWQPFFNIFGELFIDREPEDDVTTRFGTPIHDAYDEYVVWVLLALYMLITNILLLNLLIAVFNDRYVEVQAQALEIWKFNRFGLVMEYSERHWLFAPFSIIGHIMIFFKWLYRRCIGHKEINVSGLKSLITQEEMEELLEFECDCMTRMLKSSESSITKTVEEMAENILEEIDIMKSEMQVMKGQVNRPPVEEKEDPKV